VFISSSRSARCPLLSTDDSESLRWNGERGECCRDGDADGAADDDDDAAPPDDDPAARSASKDDSGAGEGAGAGHDEGADDEEEAGAEYDGITDAECAWYSRWCWCCCW
jgi:hypothetical protein